MGHRIATAAVRTLPRGLNIMTISERNPTIFYILLTYTATCAQNLVIEMVRAWEAFSVSGPTGEVLADPGKYYADAATPLSLVKNSITVALAMISDGIIVRPRFCYPPAHSQYEDQAHTYITCGVVQVWRTFVVWNFSIIVIALTVALFCADLGRSEFRQCVVIY